MHFGELARIGSSSTKRSRVLSSRTKVHSPIEFQSGLPRHFRKYWIYQRNFKKRLFNCSKFYECRGVIDERSRGQASDSHG